MSGLAGRAREGSSDGSREPRAGRDAEHTHVPAGPQEVLDPTRTRDAPGAPIILVAEDDEPIAEAVGLVLEDAGYQPVLTANGWAALAAARERWPALVITDLMMPHMSGLELVAALRAIAVTTSQRMPPVVLMTAAAVVCRPEEQGIDAVVSKPFDIAVLEAVIGRLLRHDASE